MNIVVMGATSLIAQETMKNFGRDCSFVLAGRDGEKLETVKNDLVARGYRNVYSFTVEASEHQRFHTLLEFAVNTLGGIDLLFVAHGSLHEQSLLEKDLDLIPVELNTNFVSAATLCSLFADYFEKRKKGRIAVISSVAGDRGRQSNYIYGSAKAGLSAYLQGLRNRLSHSGVDVLTIKPGIITTPMTAHMPDGPLNTDARKAGKLIHKAIIKNKDTAYIPGFWRIIMLIVKLIPERIFKKMKL